MKQKKIVMENGREFYGTGFGADRESVAEIVFNTSIVGYQEVLSDLSYTGQIVVMTYPLIGNYGINDDDYESKSPSMSGMVVHEYNDSPSNFRYTKTLSEAMEDNGIPGISGVDTREIARLIRDEGAQKCIITDSDTPLAECMEKMAAWSFPDDCVSQVSCRKRWYSRTSNPRYNVAVIDCGIKLNIIREMNQMGCNLTVLPYDTSAEDIMNLSPDGVFISNGPGDPAENTGIIENIKRLAGKLPVFGICLGHQLFALAMGGKTKKMKYGHRGANQPVKELKTGTVYISSQNHGYEVLADSIKGVGTLSFVNANDNTCEGVEYPDLNAFTVQFHPEACAGPLDARDLFDRFMNMMDGGKKNA